MSITVVVPYYRSPKMLQIHLETWRMYPFSVLEHMNLLIVDDCSPEPAKPIVQEYGFEIPIRLLRISTDIKWNRNGARNLGSMQASTPWVLHMDIDHVLPPAQAALLCTMRLRSDRWYRFERYRIGAADETRKKDAVDPEATFAKIKPHGDSYLCRRELYWKVGGYDEDYSGCLGGGSPFLEQMTAAAPMEVLPVALHVYTRNACEDASVRDLSRDTSRYSAIRMKKRLTGDTKAKNPIRFKWHKQV